MLDAGSFQIAEVGLRSADFGLRIEQLLGKAIGLGRLLSLARRAKPFGCERLLARPTSALDVRCWMFGVCSDPALLSSER
jgi:hypothetical protein